MTTQDVHPLRYAYCAAIRKQYNQFVQGDKDPAKTEMAAMKITKLGIGYPTYIDLAVKLCARMAKHFGWPYPYYNVVISDKTISKIKAMQNYTSTIQPEPEPDFEDELIYATSYVAWWFGEGSKPSRDGVESPLRIRGDVAEYLCRLHGVPYLSSNYNFICRQLESARG